MILKLVGDHTNFGLKGARIGTLPYQETHWLTTRRLPQAGNAEIFPTALSRMRREDAICVMLQGAQTASSALRMSDENRLRMKEALLSLL
jgi:hypothetical protein